MSKPTNYDEYLAAQRPMAIERLAQMTGCLFEVAPAAKLELKWGKPALVTDGIVCVFAAFKRHISLHPTPSVIRHFASDLKPYTTSANTVQFAIDQPLPAALIIKMLQHRCYEQTELKVGWK